MNLKLNLRKNVPPNFITKLALLGSFLILASCTETLTEVSTLGKKIQAPTLLSVSPFNQELKDTSLLEFRGLCHYSIDSFEFSIKNETWVPVLQQANLDPGMPAAPFNDLNCSDGNFRFFISQNDLVAAGLTLNQEGEAEDSEVKSFRLRGLSKTFGVSNEFAFFNTGEDGKPHQEPTQILLSKSFQETDITVDTCEHYRVSLHDSNGNFTQSKNDHSFTFHSKFSGQEEDRLKLFSTYADCQANTPISTLLIEKNVNNKDIYMKVSEPSAATNQVTILIRNPNPTQIISQIPAAGAVYNFHSDPSKIISIHSFHSNGSNFSPHTCYSMDVNQNGLTLGAHQTTVSLNNSSAPDLKFYAAADCIGTAISSVLLTGYAQSRIFFKYTGAALPQTAKITFSGSTTGGYIVLQSSIYLSFATLSSTDPQNLILVNYLTNPGNYECSSFEVLATNAYNEIVPINGTLNLFSSLAGTGKFFFYSDSGCASSISSLTVSNKTLVKVYYKPKLIINESLSLNVTMGSMVSSPIYLSVNDVVDRMSFYQTSIQPETCTAVELMFKSSYDLPAIIRENREIAITATVAGSSVGDINLYYDSLCTGLQVTLYSNTVSGNSAILGVSAGQSSVRLYIKSVNLLSIISGTSIGQLNLSATLTVPGEPFPIIWAAPINYYIKE